MLPLSKELLLSIEKPARYIGGEVNMAVKDVKGANVRFGFCFPDVYEIGMSHLGLSILYGFLNRRNDTYCERFFAPWDDMEKVMREKNIALFSLETYSPAADFDFFGFTLQYEMGYTNVLNVLDLAGIPFLSAERGEGFPIIIGGGPCAVNPEPLADFFDLFVIGDGEACLDEIIDIFKANKARNGTKRTFLESAAGVEGVYVPCFYDVSYNGDGTVKSFTPNTSCAPKVVKKAVVADLDSVYFPDRQIVPFLETVHDRAVVEVFRGCSRGCRFCQACFLYRPVREKNPETLVKQADTLIDATGHEEISLLSLSTGDYSRFKELAEMLLSHHCGDGVSLSLPSLRVDAFTLALMEKAQGARKSGLTFAPEAGSQRLRDVINKNLTDEEIINGCRLAFSGGWERIKLYFMTGLPTETEEDLEGIPKLCNDIIGAFFSLPKDGRGRSVNINVSSACFVPKPFTPFQWVEQNDYETFKQKNYLIRDKINKKRVKYNFHDPLVSVYEGVFARGDRRLSRLLLALFKNGAKFDAWSEKFSPEIWEKSIAEAGTDIKFYTRRRWFDEKLPWDFIDIRVSKKYLMDEAAKAARAEVTANCREVCAGCGAGCERGAE